MLDTANCPILVGHLNALLRKGGDHATIARQLVMILDDVEGIAELVDDANPAMRHAMERSRHIAGCALSLQDAVTVLRSPLDLSAGPNYGRRNDQPLIREVREGDFTREEMDAEQRKIDAEEI